MRYFRYALCAALVGAAFGAANAADVPAGTVLAENKNLFVILKMSLRPLTQ